jgi:hypothetical protein
MAIQSVEDRLARLEQRERAATLRARRWQFATIGSALLGLLLGLPGQGRAAGEAGGLPDLAKRVAVLEASNGNQANKLPPSSLH